MAPRFGSGQQVVAVGHLHGLWRTLARAVGVTAGPISADDLWRGTLPQPGSELLCRPSVQQVHRPMALTIHEHGAVAATSTDGELVHPKHARRCGLGSERRRTSRTKACRLARNP